MENGIILPLLHHMKSARGRLLLESRCQVMQKDRFRLFVYSFSCTGPVSVISAIVESRSRDGRD